MTVFLTFEELVVYTLKYRLPTSRLKIALLTQYSPLLGAISSNNKAISQVKRTVEH